MSEPELIMYAGNVGEWTEARPPTRAEALTLAARCASAAGDITVPASVQLARAAQSQAWSAIAVATPIERNMAQIGSGPNEIKICWHDVMVTRIAGSWRHLKDGSGCLWQDEPS